MKTPDGKIQAPFPYFGGKSRAVKEVWEAFGEVRNYVEPFAGSAAMLLGAPEGNRIETINDADGFIANFWRAVAADPEAVARWADFPVTENDYHARHGWMISRRDRLRWLLEDPDFYDAKIAGWWCWGTCASIGNNWCSGTGPLRSNGVRIFDVREHKGSAGLGPGFLHSRPSVGRRGGVFKQNVNVRAWMIELQKRLRHVLVLCRDWSRVVTPSVTTRHGMTAVFLDPPYTTANMDYAAGGVGGPLAMEVQRWCAENGDDPLLRIVLCGHAGEHDALLAKGWTLRKWKAPRGMGKTKAAKERRESETLWCSPACCEKTGDA